MIRGSKEEDKTILGMFYPNVAVTNIKRRKVKHTDYYRYEITYKYDNDHPTPELEVTRIFTCRRTEMPEKFYLAKIYQHEN